MTDIYLLLGSNEGKPEENLQAARQLITQRCGVVIKHSSIYQTEAWGVKDQPAFLNQALLIKTELSPTSLLTTLKVIEKELGRTETTKWGPRVIDIDILFYSNQIIDLPELKIPHPYIHERRFTLVPLNEIAPSFIHPILQQNIAQLLKICNDKSEVKLKAQSI